MESRFIFSKFVDLVFIIALVTFVFNLATLFNNYCTFSHLTADDLQLSLSLITTCQSPIKDFFMLHLFYGMYSL